MLAFSLNSGELFPKIANVNVSGEKSSYPSSESFDKNELQYLEERLLSSDNNWIRSRYAHILWIVTKNNQFAKIALDSYLKIIDFMIDNPDLKQNSRLETYIECILVISEKTKIDINEIKQKVIGIIKSNKIRSYTKLHILEFAIDCKQFKAIELKFSINLLKNSIDINKESNFFHNQSILNFAIKLSEKNGQSTSEFYTLLAENLDLIINQHQDEKDFIRFTSFGEKAKYYKKAGKIEKYNECLKEYTRLKNKFELGHFEFKLPEKETELLNEYLNKKTEIILKMPTETILNYLATCDDLLIKDEALDEMAEKAFKNSLHQFCSTSVFDININHKQTSDAEAKENERFRAYTIQFYTFYFPIFIKVMSMGIICGKINYHTVFQFLNNHSWYGQRFKRGVYERDIDENSNWLSLFAPGLHDFFSQVEWAVIMANNNIPNFILCIDSLTLKFEGAIRDFIRLLGGSTTVEKRGAFQEQLIEELLLNPIILDNFSSEDITLFRYVFTNKGWNIRNNVAHCFYPFSNYSFDKISLVFLCILKLGKYKLNQKKSE